MKELLAGVGLIVLGLLILFGLPLIVAVNLVALFGWSLWNIYWVVFFLFIMFGGTTSAVARTTHNR